MTKVKAARRANSPSITDADVAAYRRDGCLIVENLIPESSLRRLRDQVIEFIEKSRTVAQSDAVFDLEEGHTAENPLVRRIISPTLNNHYFEEVMRSDLLVDLVASLLGNNIRFQGDKLNMKPAGVGSPVEWHQDFAFYPHTNDDLLAIGIALDDSTVENGCLIAIPGSHLGGTLNHHQDGMFVGAISPSDPAVNLADAIPLEIGAGDVTIHHASLLHASSPNHSPKPRRLWLVQYAATSAWPIMGVKDFDSFNSAIVRGEHGSQFTSRKQTVRIPLPTSTTAQRTIFEVQKEARNTVYR